MMCSSGIGIGMKCLLAAGVAVLLSYSILPAATDSLSLKKNSVKAAPAAAAAERKPAASSVKQMVFEEQKIEGKIRRPQLVLIKADQRPDFGPMVMQGRGKTKNLAATVGRDLAEDASFNSAFRFEGTAIVTPAP
jgi:hypothetical protein